MDAQHEAKLEINVIEDESARARITWGHLRDSYSAGIRRSLWYYNGKRDMQRLLLRLGLGGTSVSGQLYLLSLSI